MNQNEAQIHMNILVKACAGYLCNAQDRVQLEQSLQAVAALINEALKIKEENKKAVVEKLAVTKK
jgi:hypothetical protein